VIAKNDAGVLLAGSDAQDSHGRYACTAQGTLSILGEYAMVPRMSDLPQAVKDYLRGITSKGGKARAAKLSARRKKEIAQKAARARWRNHNGK
jgi:hypothetical protein